MRYKTKLFIAAILVSAISSIFALGIVEFLTRRYLFTFLQDNVASIAGTTAALIDPDLVKQVIVSSDPKTDAYKTLAKQLRSARNANRRTGIYIKYLYITYPDPKNPKEFLFAVDAEENPKDYSPPATPDPGTAKNKLYERVDKIFAIDKPTRDPWGSWVTGYAPIFDRDGNYVGSVGADISSALVEKNLNHLLLFALIALSLSLIESIIIVFFHAKKVTRALTLLENATREVKKGNFRFRLNIDTNDEFGDLGDMMNTMNEWLEQNEKIKRGFAHYLSQNVLEKLVREEKVGKFEGEKRKMTFLHCHIHNFNNLTKNLTPEETMQFLNQYFKIMLEIIFKHNGMLDKLIGDTIIAEFGIPINDPEQESHAVLAALKMEEAIHSLDAEWGQKTSKNVEIAIGIHTGEAIFGSIDSEGKVQYTSVGNGMHIASQIANSINDLKHPIVISETTHQSLPSYFIAEEIGTVPLAETNESIRIYKILFRRKEDL